MSNEVVKWVFKLNSLIPGEQNLYWTGPYDDPYKDTDVFKAHGPLSEAYVEDTKYSAERMKVNTCTIMSVTKKQLFMAKLAGK